MNWYPCWSYRIQNYQSLPAKVKNLTQRICIHNNIEGQSIRILLSNQYGQDILYLDHLFVDIDNHTYPLAVCGENMITLYPGEEVYTDELDIYLSIKSDISIQLHIPNNKITGYVGLNSQLMIDIQHHGDIESGVLDKEFNKFVYFAIRSIEVKTDKKPYIIQTFGDSLVHQGCWMNQLFYDLYQTRDNVVVINEGISGNRLLKDATSSSQLNTIFGKAGIHRFERDVFKRFKPDLVIFAEGINDLVHPGNGCALEELPNYQEMKEGYMKIQDIVKHYQSQIMFATLSPFYNYDRIWTPEREKIRQDVNTWIRSQCLFIDIDECLRDKSAPQKLMEYYDSGDHLHFNHYAGKIISLQILKQILKKEG